MSHDHGHHDLTQAADHRRRIAVAFGITATLVVAQAIGALITGSLALLVDTAHMITDSAGLLLALVAASLTLLPASAQRTWGFRRAEVLAALGQAGLLLVVGVYVLVEAVRRLVEPPEIPSATLIVFGVIGLVANLAALLVLAGRRRDSFNLRAAFLEVLNDALGSLAVIVAAVIIATTGWQRADTVAALVIGALIIPRAVRLLRETVNVLLEATPPGLDLDDVRAHLLRVDHVEAVHDLHASLIASGLPTLSAHIVVDDTCFHDGHAPQILDSLQRCVAEHFDVAVEHSTFQLEMRGHTDHEAPSHQ